MNDLPEISVAPMMDWTDRHCRYFLRLISPHVRLYTEMVTTGAILHGERDRFLRFDAAEHPIALQLGGSSPAGLADCAKIGAEYGYDEINLNCGCPSDRVQNGMFGACLMKRPDHVAECFDAMQNAAPDVPVTIKCRIGVDNLDDFAFLDEFVGRIADKGCRKFIIHARKAWLSGLSPKENREIPELNYDRAREIKAQYPHLTIILNGGLTSASQIKKELRGLDGAMIGREAYSNPYMLTDIEREIFGNTQTLSRPEIAEKMIAYAQNQQAQGTPVKSITRHILGLFHHQKGGKAWRRTLSTLPYENGAEPDVIGTALKSVYG